MMIDFTNEELDLIYDCLTDRNQNCDDEKESELIDEIFDKILKASKNEYF